MSKNIAISDDVYRGLKRGKGDRSFSEVIEEHLKKALTLADVTGQGILDEPTLRDVERDIEPLSEGTMERLDDEIG